MARFFFYSGEGEALFLAHRLQEDGHDVTFWVQHPECRKLRLGEGVVPLAASPEPKKGAVVIFDQTGKGKAGADFRRRGFKVIGGNPFDADLELDRSQGTKIMQALGIATPKTQVMASVHQAQAYLATRSGTWFFKPNGKSTTLTHHGEPKDLIRWLDWGQQFIKGEPFELQQGITGIEISTEAWFDGTRFVPPFNATLEEKHFLTGDLGPRTGCESNVVWIWSGTSPALPAATVLRLAPMLKASGYVGPIDLNAILTDDGEPHGLEWSARLGFDASQAYSMLIDGDYGEQLEKFAHGDLTRWKLDEDRFAMTLRVTTPPYPVEHAGAGKAMAGLPLDKAILGDAHAIFPCDVRKDRQGPCLAGWSGYVCAVGATGTSFDRCRATVLSMAEKLTIPEKQFRTDPVHRAETDWSALARMGYVARHGLAA